MKDEQTISIEINKQTTSEENANEVEIRIVSIASDEYIPFESEQQVTCNSIFTNSQQWNIT